VVVSFAKPASNGGSRVLNHRVVCKSRNGGAKGANEGLKSQGFRSDDRQDLHLHGGGEEQGPPRSGFSAFRNVHADPT
jgi:hypothetical protein